MAMEKVPDEVPGDILQAKFKVGVLENGVMPAIERGRADIQALLVGNFFRADEAGRIASARGSDGGIVGMREKVAQRDARERRFDKMFRWRVR